MRPAGVIRVAGVPLPLLRMRSHACPYLPQRVASDLVALGGPIDGTTYQMLMDRGFRRSGLIVYRPDCPGCRACVPIRVPVERFHASHSQRRVARRNADLHVAIGAPACDAERLDLFERYQAWRHGGAMSGDAEDCRRFLCESPIETLEFAYRVDGRLVGVGIVDVCSQSLSSVYFFYDPDERRRSLGVFSGLCEIAECRRRRLPWWYIGFHVQGCAKMEYKTRFRPYELLHADGRWRAGDARTAAPAD